MASKLSAWGRWWKAHLIIAAGGPSFLKGRLNTVKCMDFISIQLIFSFVDNNDKLMFEEHEHHHFMYINL
jgi:hypothetical protein